MQRSTILMVSILVGISFMSSGISFGVAETGDEVDTPEYEIGDYWIYNSTLINNISGEVRYEVIDIREIQDFWDDKHECYQINTSMDFTIEWENYILNGWMRGEIYERTADLFAIESIMESNVTAVDDDYFESIYLHQYFQNSGSSTIFPLILGSEFDVSVNMIHTTISNINGVEHNLFFEEPISGQYSVSISDSLHQITTPAGTFECVEITVFLGNTYLNATTVRYYSDVVGRDVKSETIQLVQDFPDMNNISGNELLEYRSGSTISISGFSFVGTFCLLGIIAIMLHRFIRIRNK